MFLKTTLLPLVVPLATTISFAASALMRQKVIKSTEITVESYTLSDDAYSDKKDVLKLGIYPDNGSPPESRSIHFEFDAIAEYNPRFEVSVNNPEYLYHCVELVDGSLIGDKANQFVWVDSVDQYEDSHGEEALQRVVLFAYPGCRAPNTGNGQDMCDKDLSDKDPGTVELKCEDHGEEATEGLTWKRPAGAPDSVYPTRSIAVFGKKQCSFRIFGHCPFS